MVRERHRQWARDERGEWYMSVSPDACVRVDRVEPRLEVEWPCGVECITLAVCVVVIGVANLLVRALEWNESRHGPGLS